MRNSAPSGKELWRVFRVCVIPLRSTTMIGAVLLAGNSPAELAHLGLSKAGGNAALVDLKQVGPGALYTDIVFHHRGGGWGEVIWPLSLG